MKSYNHFSHRSYQEETLADSDHRVHLAAVLLVSVHSVSCCTYQRHVTINISGREFRTKLANFSRYPESRLGRIAGASSLDCIRQLCDGFVPGPVPVLYFDRNHLHFGTVLDVYRKREGILI